jgi:hypothetical protein
MVPLHVPNDGELSVNVAYELWGEYACGADAALRGKSLDSSPMRPPYHIERLFASTFLLSAEW